MTANTGPVRILIVDDEDLARQRLRTLLSRRADFEIVGECATGGEAVKAIREIGPEIVVSEIGAHNMPVVIFATAYDDYAIDAFEVGAVDYILKPVDEERFNRTLDRATRRAR